MNYFTNKHNFAVVMNFQRQDEMKILQTFEFIVFIVKGCSI